MNNDNTIYNNEKLQYQNQDEEATQFDKASSRKRDTINEKETGTPNANPKKSFVGGNVATGLGAGILLGAVTSVFSGTTFIKHHRESHPEWTDGEVAVATSVNDDMSFSEAFNAARAEVGSGGVFEWHHNIYSTYTEEEWNNMTPADRAEYGSHFYWHDDSHTDTIDSNPSQPMVDEVEVEIEDVIRENEQTVDEIDIEEVVIGTDGGNTIIESDVEVLGIVNDDAGANTDGLVVDEQEAVLIDIDEQEAFNFLAEMSMMDDPLYTPNNDGDYINDISIYEN